MTSALRVVLDGLIFPEGPRWRNGELWFSDMHAREIIAMTPAGARRTIHTHHCDVSGLGWLPDGRLLFVLMDDRKLMRMEADGAIVTHADLGHIATWHCNDMVVDAQGRAYVGNFGFSLDPPAPQVPAKLALVQPDGAVSIAAEDLVFPNGAVITPDGKTLIIGESFASRITAFDIGAYGALTNRRVFAEIAPAVPDGMCLDAEGAVWVASPTTNEVIRVAKNGAIAARVPVGRTAVACMLGGEDRKMLYVLTSPVLGREECERLKTGRIEVMNVDVPGAGLP